MADLIERRYFTDAVIHEYLGSGFASCAPDIRDMIADAPAVDAVPVRHGRWNWSWNDMPQCSRCGCAEAYITPYCPHCGAKMDEEENDG